MKYYKETPTGKIPKLWKVVRIKEIAKTEAGGTPSTSVKEYWNGSVPWINSGELKNNVIKSPTKYISRLGLKNSAAKLFPKDTVVIALTGATTGMVGYLDFECSTNQSVVGILPNNKFSSKFLFHYLVHSRNRILRFNVGSAQPHINKRIVDDFLISLPSLSEQEKIADTLSTVDEGIQQAEETIAKTERLKKSVMHKLLTKGIGHKEFKETKLGKIPKTWQVTRLGNILEVCQYGLSIAMSSKGKYPIVRMDEISDGYVRQHITKYVDLDQQTFNSFKLEKGDVLFNRTNSYELVGRTGIFLLDGDYVFASYLIRLRPEKQLLDSLFLTFYFIFSHNRLRQLATRAVHQANINATNLKHFKIVLPPLEEQRKIATTISTVDNKLRLDNKRKGKLERIKKGLMNDLLSGKIRVKVD